MESRTEREILRDMLTHAEENGLIQTSADLIEAIENGERTENQYVLDLATHAYILHQYESFLASGFNNLYLDSAMGDALDRIGLLLNVTRYPATAAKVEVTLQMETSTISDITIPKGTALLTSNQGGVYTDYITSEAVTILANTASATVMAECIDLGYGPVLDVGEVEAIVVDESTTLTATNTERGTPGRDIEEDDHYRQRIIDWASATQLGSKTYIENYLYNYDGISSFKLIPQFEGIGTLEIVVDAPTSLLDSIADEVYEKCMLVSDVAPTVVRPDPSDMASLEVYVKGNVTRANSEFEEMLLAQMMVYVEGGITRNGRSHAGLGVGESFEPAKCIQYMLAQFPELTNIYFDDMSTVTCEDTEQLRLGTVEVVWPA